jgi:hypothetical protein
MANRIVIAIAMLFVGGSLGYIIGDMYHPTTIVDYPVIHNYDYILEVKATDSIEHIFIYDINHAPVGDFYTSNPDSLQIIIDDDNL